MLYVFGLVFLSSNISIGGVRGATESIFLVNILSFPQIFRLSTALASLLDLSFILHFLGKSFAISCLINLATSKVKAWHRCYCRDRYSALGLGVTILYGLLSRKRKGGTLKGLRCSSTNHCSDHGYHILLGLESVSRFASPKKRTTAFFTKARPLVIC